MYMYCLIRINEALHVDVCICRYFFGGRGEFLLHEKSENAIVGTVCIHVHVLLDSY